MTWKGKKITNFFVEKIRENEMVLHCLAADHFKLTRKIMDFVFVEKNSWKHNDFANLKNSSIF